MPGVGHIQHTPPHFALDVIDIQHKSLTCSKASRYTAQITPVLCRMCVASSTNPGNSIFSPGWRTHHILPCTGVPSLQKSQDMNINIRLKICMLHKFRLKLDVSDIQLQNCHNSPNSNLMVLNLFPTLTCGVFVFSA